MALAWNSPVLALRPLSAQVSAIQYSICLKQTHQRSAMVSPQPVLWGLRITIEKNSRFDGRSTSFQETQEACCVSRPKWLLMWGEAVEHTILNPPKVGMVMGSCQARLKIQIQDKLRETCGNYMNIAFQMNCKYQNPPCHKLVLKKVG